MGGPFLSPAVRRHPAFAEPSRAKSGMPTHIKILSGGAMRSLMLDVVPLFERASGVKVEIEFRLTSVLQKEIEDGAAFDIALLPRPELDALVRAGKIAPDSSRHHALGGRASRCAPARRSPILALSMRSSARSLAAKSIAYSDGPSGAYIAELLERLGIAEEMKPKTKLTSRPVAELVAAGEAEIGMQQIVAILPVKGAELVGPLPSELQNIIVYAAGLSAGAQNRRRGRELHCLYAHCRGGRGSSAPRAWSRDDWLPGKCRRCACAIALLCPYRLDLGR